MAESRRIFRGWIRRSTLKHCDYDRNLDEPCGQPAVIKVRLGKHVMWMCAQLSVGPLIVA